jgi:hypothetical protein
VKRGEETYGPYSLGDLQKYVQSGNIALTDLTQSEGMADWAPISQVIGTVQVPMAPVYGMPASPVYGMPAVQGSAAESVPLPPNLHWAALLAILIVLNFVQIGVVLNIVWTFILANWARKLDGDNNTMVYVAMYPAGVVAGFIAIVVSSMGRSEPGPLAGIGFLLIIGGFIAYVVGMFKIKAAMEAYYNFNENIGLHLSGVMTFFFSIVYLQFHVNRIAKWKSTGILE